MHYEQKLANNCKYFQHAIFKALDIRFINNPIVDYAFTTKLRYKEFRSN